MVQLATDVRKKDLQVTSKVFVATCFRRLPTTAPSRMTTSMAGASCLTSTCRQFSRHPVRSDLVPGRNLPFWDSDGGQQRQVFMAEETMEVAITWLTNNIQVWEQRAVILEWSNVEVSLWLLSLRRAAEKQNLVLLVKLWYGSWPLKQSIRYKCLILLLANIFSLVHGRHHFWVPDISGVEPQQVSCFFQEGVFHLLHHLYQLWYMMPRRYLGTFCLLMRSCLQMAVFCLASVVILTISGPATIQCLRPSGLSYSHSSTITFDCSVVLLMLNSRFCLLLCLDWQPDLHRSDLWTNTSPAGTKIRHYTSQCERLYNHSTNGKHRR